MLAELYVIRETKSSHIVLITNDYKHCVNVLNHLNTYVPKTQEYEILIKDMCYINPNLIV